jgi:hypothetical protein
MLHSRAGYRSARPILFITHIRLATHGRSIQMCQATFPPFDALMYSPLARLRYKPTSTPGAGLDIEGGGRQCCPISINSSGRPNL